MLFGILGGLTAALINSADYLFSARFLIYHKSPVRLLVISSILMMIISLPAMFLLVPFSTIPCLWKFLTTPTLVTAQPFWGLLGAQSMTAYWGRSRWSLTGER